MVGDCFLCTGSTQRVTWPLCRCCFRDLGRSLSSREAFRQNADTSLPFPLFALGSYEGAFARLVKVMKSQPSSYQDPRAEILLRTLVHHYVPQLPAVAHGIVPLPGNPFRVFQQSDLALLFGQMYAKVLGIPIETRLLQKTFWSTLRHGSPQQKTLPLTERLMAPQFSVPRLIKTACFSSSTYVLVDDVCATGSSLKAAARILDGEGHRVVAAIVLAKSRRHGLVAGRNLG